MNRDEMMTRARDRRESWDVVVIGGGATGVGIAIDAASRGYETLLVERFDFGKGTSSRATKLVHGGVRYLRQGNIKLVREALAERTFLLEAAPHVVHPLRFLIPSYSWWGKPFYGLGLKVYDWLSAERTLAGSRMVGRDDALELVKTLEPARLYGGVVYEDGQFDDARLLINLVQTAAHAGATILNYAPVISLIKGSGKLAGVLIRDEETGAEVEAKSRIVINATGVFTDDIRQLDQPGQPHLVRPSQGIHLVFERSFLPGDTAIMVPSTDDGRVLFAIPWHNRVVVGTTDTPRPEAIVEPRALEAEIDFVLAHAGRYLTRDPNRADVLSVYAGLRPLVNAGSVKTSQLSRDHTIQIDPSGLLTITGGKWTTYRRMAEDAVNRAADFAGLAKSPCRTRSLAIRGASGTENDFTGHGADSAAVEALCRSLPLGGDRLHADFPYRRGEVAWAARHEMARTVEDVLARRTRLLFLDAAAAQTACRTTAEILAGELRRSPEWVDDQVARFADLARGYQIS